jgi:hypothetical protein
MNWPFCEEHKSRYRNFIWFLGPTGISRSYFHTIVRRLTRLPFLFVCYYCAILRYPSFPFTTIQSTDTSSMKIRREREQYFGRASTADSVPAAQQRTQDPIKPAAHCRRGLFKVLAGGRFAEPNQRSCTAETRSIESRLAKQGHEPAQFYEG